MIFPKKFHLSKTKQSALLHQTKEPRSKERRALGAFYRATGASFLSVILIDKQATHIMPEKQRAFVTLATTEEYAKGACVLAASLKQANTAFPAVCLVSETLSKCALLTLGSFFTEVITVPAAFCDVEMHAAIEKSSHALVHHLKRPELKVTFMKIFVWSLVQYEKLIFIDADMLALDNIDDLFERPELAACADAGWPDCFNSGLFVCVPSAKTLQRLIAFALKEGSFDGADQGLLNEFFADWASLSAEHRIPFVYNVTINSHYSYVPAALHFRRRVKCVHFIGAQKPWFYPSHSGQSNAWDAPTPATFDDYLRDWWRIFNEHVKPVIEAVTKALSAEDTSFNTLNSIPGLRSAAWAASPDGTSGAFSGYRVQWRNDVEALCADNRRQLEKPKRLPEIDSNHASDNEQ